MLLLNCNKGGNEMKKKVNYYKIGALVMLVVEILVAIWMDKGVAEENLWTWRLFVLLMMCIPINVIFICAKRKVKK